MNEHLPDGVLASLEVSVMKITGARDRIIDVATELAKEGFWLNVGVDDEAGQKETVLNNLLLEVFELLIFADEIDVLEEGGDISENIPLEIVHTRAFAGLLATVLRANYLLKLPFNMEHPVIAGVLRFSESRPLIDVETCSIWDWGFGFNEELAAWADEKGIKFSE